ncbi:outer membrane beta-barrel protein [Halanaerobium salsuginis]|uniref:Outer membrane protein beta-barrel domain-containing protein n=1 Tax=Halanaerobium salsuginis TaxID=29563 RepID=A0A1I4I3C6_9FIRM|nr:outer membrane beta-barrel protein [Halanaerobium salsuginis]SFL48301.1 Outer membrane protein beta-barrel domain-containing protein [Halanaerobium salsuginis]
MKKVVVISLLLVLAFSFNTMAKDSYFSTKLGVSFNGDSIWEMPDSDTNISLDTDPGAVLAVEYFRPVTEHVDLGVGLAYQFKKDLDYSADSDVSDLKITSIPAYLTLKYNSDQVYLISQLGYSSFDLDYNLSGDGDIDSDGGLYYGLGAGYKFAENKFWELLYSVSNGEIKDNVGDHTEKIDVENSQLTLSFGMSF